MPATIADMIRFLLGSDYPERRPGESSDAHITRVLQALPPELPAVVAEWRDRAVMAHNEEWALPEE